MSSAAAQAYARVANTTSSPRDIEAQALLTAANKLQAVMTNVDATYAQTFEALTFNRKLWSIFLSEAQRDTIRSRSKYGRISQILASSCCPIPLRCRSARNASISNP